MLDTYGLHKNQPWLVLMTDGAPNGNAAILDQQVQRVQQLVESKKLTVFPIGIGDSADMNVLARFSPGRAPLKLKGLNFTQFFAWLSKSVSKVSQSTPGDRIPPRCRRAKGLGRTLKYQLKKNRSLIASKRIRRRWRANRARAHSWSLASARCVGSSHLQSDTPCQDWASTHAFDNGDVAIALADGAGSAKFSHYGSSLVVRRISKLISEHFDEAFGSTQEKDLFKKRLISQLQIDLNELAKLGIDLPDSEKDRHDAPSRSKLLLVPCDMANLACTALCVVVRGNRYIAVHVGDGVIGTEVSRKGKTSLEILSMPDNGEFANETYFVTSRKALESSRLITGRIDNGENKSPALFSCPMGRRLRCITSANPALRLHVLSS